MKKSPGFGPFVLRILFSATLLSMAMVGAAQATTIAVQAISGGSNFPAFNGTNQTIGWAFTPTSDIWVTDLGFWDSTPGSSLGQTHEVGLWTTGGTLLASTTILQTSVLIGEFRYEAISSVALTAGINYLIGAAITSPFSDAYKVPSALTMASEITLLGSARNGSSAGFSAPTTVTAGNGRFGPNFAFTTSDPDPVAVPEPASLGLLGIGASLCLVARRRRTA